MTSVRSNGRLSTQRHLAFYASNDSARFARLEKDDTTLDDFAGPGGEAMPEYLRHPPSVILMGSPVQSSEAYISSCKSLVVENSQDPRAMTPVMQEDPSAPPVFGVFPVPAAQSLDSNAFNVHTEHAPEAAMRLREMMVLAFILRDGTVWVFLGQNKWSTLKR